MEIRKIVTVVEDILVDGAKGWISPHARRLQ